MKFAYLVNNLLPSQLNFLLIKTLNQEVIKNRFIAPTMHISNAYAYNGTIMATTLSTAEKLIIFPSPAKKYFLVWDLEWLRIKQRNFRFLSSIYSNPDLILVARSEDHKQVIENCWNVKTLLFSNFIKYE